MSHSRLKFGRALVLAALIGSGLTACGRKGPLEAPPNAAAAVVLPDRDIGAEQSQFTTPSDTSPLGRAPRANQAITVPDKSFVLDPIL